MIVQVDDSTTQRGMRMGQEYKGHVFDILIKSVPDSDRCTYKAAVHIPQGARDRVTKLNCTRDFSSLIQLTLHAVIGTEHRIGARLPMSF
jgi:hypothetical protein